MSSPSLSNRLLGLGRRTTMSVQPVHPSSAHHKLPHTLETSSSSYSPPAPVPVSSSHFSPSDSPASTPRHHKPASLGDGRIVISPVHPDGSESPSQQGGRINDILGLGKARPSVARARHLSQLSSSSLSSSSSTNADQDDSDDISIYHSTISLTTASALSSQSPSSAHFCKRVVLKEGPLRKQSPKGFHLWQQRFVSLYSDSLQYCKGSSSRTVQGNVPLRIVKFVYSVGGRRFDVVVGEESVARTFHFEAQSEAEAHEWVAAIMRASHTLAAVQDKIGAEEEKEATPTSSSSSATPDRGLLPQHSSAARGSASGQDSRSGSSRRRTDGLSIPTISRISHSSYLPTSHGSISPSASPVPLTPVSPMKASPPPITAPGISSPLSHTTVTAEERRGGEVRSAAVSAAIEVVEKVDMLRLGTTLMCRERSRGDVWHLMHVLPKNHPLASSVRTAHGRMQALQLPHLLTPLLHSETSDSLFALYTPAFRPTDSLFHYLQLHRRLPEPAVKHIAVSCVRALTALHNIGHQYRQLCPATLAFDGDGRLVLIDPLFSIANLLSPTACLDAEYQLPPREHESAIADWWRLGLLLYELAVGLPPVRAAPGTPAGKEWQSIAAQLADFHPLALPFPPFVSPLLQSLIRQLLMESEGRVGGGEQGDAEVALHDFFADVDWDTVETPTPLWVKQNVQRHSVRTSMGLPSVTARTTSQSVSSNTPPSHQTPQMSPSSSIGLSPTVTPPGSSRAHPFFPPQLVISTLSPYEVYLTQKPPRSILTHPTATPSHAPTAVLQQASSVRVTLLGGRNFPLPKDDKDDASALAKMKRRTLDRPQSTAVTAVATHGVFVAVECVNGDVNESADGDGGVKVSKMVVGSAACQPSFGDEFTFPLSAEPARMDAVELCMEIRHGKIGSAMRTDAGAGRSGLVGRVVGSISLPLTSLRSACQLGQEIWHSIIDASGLVVGELHVRYAFEFPQQPAGTTAPREPWWLRSADADSSGAQLSFESIFGVRLVEDVPAGKTELSGRSRSGTGELSVVMEGKEEHSQRSSAQANDVLSSHLLEDARASVVASDFHSDLQEQDEMFEPQERRCIDRALALASSSSYTSAKPSAVTLYSSRPTAADVSLVHSILPSSHRRYHHDGISVDLSFITPRIAVMSSPVAASPQPSFRNVLGHLELCLEGLKTSGPDSLRVYHLSVETIVPRLGSATYAFAPSSVLPFEQVVAFCREAQAYLYGDPERRVLLHCLSGVGRCGLLVCCLLLFDRQVETAAEAVSVFCQQRLSSPTPSPLLTPSQLRFVQYMQRYMARLKRPSFNLAAPTPSSLASAFPLRLTHIRTTPAPATPRSHRHRWHLRIRGPGGRTLYDSAKDGSGAETAGGARMDVSAGGGVEVGGEFEMLLRCGDNDVAAVWLHSFFVGADGYVKLRRDELDWSHADDGAQHWPHPELALECFFSI